jgi:hypothetical protein
MAIFDLPAGAPPGRDTPVGQDELGRTVYRTAIGQQYTMPEPPRMATRAAGPVQGPLAYASPQRMADMSAYASDLRGMQGSYSTEDIAAAGYSPMEVAAFSTAGRPAVPFSQEADRDRQRAPADVLQEPDYTMRADVTARVQNALMEQVGMDAYNAGMYARRIMGDPNASGILESLGLIDFASMLGGSTSLAAKGVGLAGRAVAAAPAALSGLFNVEEGTQTAQRGYREGSALQTGLGAVQAVAGMAEMFPASKLIADSIASTASKMDPNTLYSVFGPPMPPQPVRAPDTGAGGGRPPLTFDEVDRAMQEAPLAEVRRITPSDIRDARIIPTVADLTRTGGYYTGIDASKVDVPEPMMGGPRYPLLQSSQQAGLAWAVQGKSIGTKKAGSGADLIAVTAMNPTSHQSNISFINSLIKTTSAYVRDGRIQPEVLGELDARVRTSAAGGDPALARLERFPGFESPNLQEFINGASFQERSRIADIIGSKGMQEQGMPNVNRVLQETVDPLYAGANPRDTLLFIEPDFSAPPVDLLAEGLPVHPSYRYGIRGRVFGALDQNISTFEMFPDFWGEKNINVFGEGFNKGGRRAFDMSLPVQEVTGKQVENLERLLQSSSNQFPVGSAMRLSPIDTRIVTNSLLNRWKPTNQPVNAGGASPQAFVDAITNSKYRPALTNYTAQDIKAGAKSGDLIAYQLGDDDVFFAIDAKPDYSWAGVDMIPGDKALVGVVSNAPGAKGTAAPSVMAKAIEDGVTVLDAFAVPSKKFPNGFLPTYYRKFGFEEAGRVPFDKEMYISDHGEQAYKDLLEAWRSDGWDESMGMPPVIVMRWSGNNADRTATAAGIRGAGAPSHRAAPEGLIPEAEGLAGRGGERPVSTEQAGDGRGIAGGVGTGDGLRLAPRTGEAAKGILGLTPEQLRNRGIPEDQIQQLMQLRELER